MGCSRVKASAQRVASCRGAVTFHETVVDACMQGVSSLSKFSSPEIRGQGLVIYPIFLRFCAFLPPSPRGLQRTLVPPGLASHHGSMHVQPLLHSRQASLRCTLSLLAIALPSRELAPADVVRAQLEALQADDLQTCYAFASPANRRNIGPWPNLEVIVKRTPAFSPLAGCASFEVLSALSLGDRWTCRVRVAPGDAWRHCMDRSASPAVGERVRLSSDPKHLRRALETVDYRWSERMKPMAGTEVEVLCDSRPNRGTNIVGLPSPDGSQGGVWYFPVTALQRPEGAPGAAAAAHDYVWQLSRQAWLGLGVGLA